MSFGLYAAGFLIMLCGLIYGAHLMHIPGQWIGVGAIVLFGIGILSAVKLPGKKIPPDCRFPHWDHWLDGLKPFNF